MASWIMSAVLMGAASASGIEIITGIVTLFSALNTSLQGITNITKIIRLNNELNNIREILDKELMLEVRIKVLKHFIEELKEIRFSFKSRILLEAIIPNVNECIKDIQFQLSEINKKIEYNKSLWIFPSFRKYSFNKNELSLRTLSSRLQIIEDNFFKTIENDAHYIKYKLDKKNGFSGVKNERLLKSEYLSSEIFSSQILN